MRTAIIGQRVRLEHPATAANGPDRVRPEHAAHADEDRVATSLAQVLDADAAGELPAADDLAGIFCQREENSPLLCAQMPEGVDGI